MQRLRISTSLTPLRRISELCQDRSHLRCSALTPATGLSLIRQNRKATHNGIFGQGCNIAHDAGKQGVNNVNDGIGHTLATARVAIERTGNMRRIKGIRRVTIETVGGITVICDLLPKPWSQEITIIPTMGEPIQASHELVIEALQRFVEPDCIDRPTD